MPERIDIVQFDLANEKVIHSKCLYIELGQNYFMYAGNYTSSKPVADDSEDHTLGWQESATFFKHKILKSSVVSVEIRWIEKRKYWCVEMECNGHPTTISLYFQTKIEAEPIYQKLDKFIFQ